ncbi:ADK [Symbiodinium natans]|uniref:adenosine kinase n=1 Tax=Symbiodinium natans TaxID=878477 RepID=A0A812SUT0_9DINO|nr:ADK [Symbiodinium natans]
MAETPIANGGTADVPGSRAPQCQRLLCMGGSLLEVRAEVPKAFLEEYKLRPNAVVQVEGHMQSMLSEIGQLSGEAGLALEYAATGAATNTALTVQALLQQDQGPMSSEAIRRQTPIVSILGGVGRDQLGYKLQDFLKQTGIQPLFSEIVSESTGWTALLCASRRERAERPALSSPSEDKGDGPHKLAVVYRAIQAGAANQYKLDHLRFKVWEQVEAAGVVYAEATFLTVSFESVKILAEHCAKMGNTFCLNLSAPYVCRYFGDRILTVMPYTDFVFGSETEYMALAEQKKSEGLCQDVDSVATWLARMPRSDGEVERRRHIVVTCGSRPSLVASTWRGYGVKVQRFPVPPVRNRSFVRKDGAGDAFAGGFLYGLMHEADVDSCVQLALYCASVAVQRTGPGYSFKDKPSLDKT